MALFSLSVFVGLFYGELLRISWQSGESVRDSRKAFNMKQIALHIMMYEDRYDQFDFSMVYSAYDVAVELAREFGYNDYTVYIDPHDYDSLSNVDDERIVLPDGLVNPDFLEADFAYVFALKSANGELYEPSVPVVWPYGLRLDGQWPDKGPKGFIAFADTSVHSYWHDRVEFERFDGDGFTHSYIKALPKGTRIVSRYSTPREANKPE